MKKLLIIDSNSIINRAYYGVRFLSSKDGTPTNAIYGFLNTLFKLIEEVGPDYLCTAYDLKAPTFRHKMYDEYKAQRKPMPDGLKVQMPISKDILAAMNIKSYELAGYEADDIIGTISKICDDNEIECFIATGDKDDLQLATDKTKVILTVTRNGVNETTYYDDKKVFERYRVTPTEFIDIKALMGDASDNIPGALGIGEKTAMSLIEKYKSIEYIYENIDNLDIKGATLRKLTDSKESVILSKKLATIVRDVPIEFKFEDCEFGGDLSSCATQKAYDELNKLNLNSIIKRLSLKPSETQIKKSVDIFKNTKYEKLDSLDKIDEFLKNVSDEMSFLFEYSKNCVSKIALAIENEAVVVDLSEVREDAVIEKIKPYFENEKIRLMGADIKESLVKLNGKMEFKNIYYDVEIAQYLINSAKSEYSIESLVKEYFDIDLDIDEKKGQVSLFEDNSDWELLAKRVLSIRPLYEKTYEILKENEQERLYFEVELPLVRVLADMQVFGIKIDKEELLKFSDMLQVRIDSLTEQIYELSGEVFNINSPKQLGVILFEKLGLKSGKKTKTGYSTGIEVLEKLRAEHPIIELLMDYRQYTKLKSTYCDSMLALIDPNTQRIHSQFKQTVTVTGRISSTEPNLQNIPVRTELGRELRKMFTAQSEDYILVDADYSQIELRVLSHIAEDETMQNAFKNNEDIHTVTASQVLGIPIEDVTPEERSSAKAVNFGIVYGIGEFSLSKDLKISVKEARDYISGYLDKYHGVSEYMKRIKQEAKDNGYVKTMMNRIRYIPELKSTNHNIYSFGERVALNTPIQGTAADIIKLAMVRVYDRLKKEGLGAKLILQVHDELIIEAPKEEKEIVCALLKEEMENAVELKIPLVADTSSGFSWYDAK